VELYLSSPFYIFMAWTGTNLSFCLIELNVMTKHVVLENLRGLYYRLCFRCVAGVNEQIACTQTGCVSPSGRMHLLLPSLAVYFVRQINRLEVCTTVQHYLVPVLWNHKNRLRNPIGCLPTSVLILHYQQSETK
jgi:hypothetical protein